VRALGPVRTSTYVPAGAANRVVSKLSDGRRGSSLRIANSAPPVGVREHIEEVGGPVHAVGRVSFPTWPKPGPPEARLARPPHREGGVGALCGPASPYRRLGGASGRAVYLRWSAPTAEEKT
jgi:hypothetical protein